MDATFSCDFSGPKSGLPHFWEHTVGSDHAPMALRADWQAQLRRCHDELGFRHVRFHGLLSDDVGTLIRHRASLLGPGDHFAAWHGNSEFGKNLFRLIFVDFHF